MQAGFRKGRGCRTLGIITYIDFTAAFDSILHSYLHNAIKSYGVPLMYCRLVRAIYDSAKVRVRIQEKNGKRMYSRNVDIRRSIIQGDIPSPVCFLIALDKKLLKDHGALNQGIQINEYLVLSHLAFADLETQMRKKHPQG